MEPGAPEQYLRLALLIDRRFPGYVDAYYGPPILRAALEAEDLPSDETLADLALALQESLASDPALSQERRIYLGEELRAMRTTIRILAGDVFDIVEEVESLYGVTPEWIDERVFTEAHRLLEDILPGSGPLQERVMGFRERSRILAETASPLIDSLMEDLRGRTQAVFGLPPEERCEVTFVRDQPWMAYNWYLGGGRSRIDFNQDVPIEVWNLLNTVAHEAYPGHHTERVIKDQLLYREEGRLEHAAALSNTPSALVSEGIAENALETILSQEEFAATTLRCYEQAALPREDALRVMDFIQAYRRLDRVTDNQMLLLYREHASDEEVISYGVRYGLMDEADGEHLLRFFRDPLSRSYAYNYTLGRELIASYLSQSGDKKAAFQRLLIEPFTPDRIRRSLASQD